MDLYKLSFPNGKEYIGITTKTAQDRFNSHCCLSNKKYAVHHAIHKYGKENVKLTVLATVDNWELLCLAEQEAIEKFNTKYPNGYNIQDGGWGAVGLVASDETRLKISISCKKWNLENQEKAKEIRLKTIETTQSDEYRKKASKRTSDMFLARPELRFFASIRGKERFNNESNRKVQSEKVKEWRKNNPEKVKIMDEKRKRTLSTEEQRIKNSERNKGKKAKPETLLKMSESMKKNRAENPRPPISEETRLKMSESAKKRKR